MAQTGVAHGEHDHQSAHNPALLGGRARQHLSLGYQSVLFETEYSGTSHGRDQHAVNATSLGVTLPLPFGGGLAQRLALGFSAYSPRELVTRAELLYADTPQFPLLAPRAQCLNLATGLGVLVHPRLRLGVGVQWLASLVGSVVVTGSDEGTTTTVVRDELVTSLAPVAGVSAEPLDDLHVGLVWRDEHRSEVDVKIQVSELGALVLPNLNIAGLAQYDPEQVDAEIQWVPERWSLVFGVRYRHWSAFPGFLGPTFECPPEAPVCGTQAPANPGFSDTWTPKAAIAFRIALSDTAQAELRSGVAYEPTPIPEQRGSSNLWDNARVVGSAGYGLRFEAGGVPLSLEIAVQRHWLRERTHAKSSEASAQQPQFSKVVTAGAIQLFALA
ncbi:MAG TPA: outer membrane protein transport protein, partial [Polyangiaceae bacterium]|nr:outer membrane protein transport protein [Polyangiaceae bacterium]